MNKLEEYLARPECMRLMSLDEGMSLQRVRDINNFIIATNLEDQTNIKEDAITFKIAARRLIRKYLEVIVELEGLSLKNKISALKDSEVVDFISQQGIRNNWDRTAPDNVWMLKFVIKKFKNSSPSIFYCYRAIEDIVRSKELYGVDLIEKIKAESYDL